MGLIHLPRHCYPIGPIALGLAPFRGPLGSPHTPQRARARPAFWVKRGEISMTLMDVQELGAGDMLLKIEELRKKLAAEGIFAAEHKQALPFLPRKVGLICGKNAQAKDDVMQNAYRRWPSVAFEVREVAVGNSPSTPREVAAALAELDAMEGVDVIVISRGGGALEEVVFPFSDEGLVRAVFAASTPVVSAIGHETDQPLIDFVADFRASTPTDAAKNIVPDLATEREIVAQMQSNLKNALLNRIEHEQEMLRGLRYSRAKASRILRAQPKTTRQF